MITQTASGTKNILIVDDQLTMAELWRMKFTQLGFGVQLVRDGLDAIDVMRQRKFDLILLDLYMPKKDGFAVLAEKVTTLNADTPTYVITSSIRDDDLIHAKALGAKRSFLKYQTSPKDVVSAVEDELAK